MLLGWGRAKRLTLTTILAYVFLTSFNFSFVHHNVLQLECDCPLACLYTSVDHQYQIVCRSHLSKTDERFLVKSLLVNVDLISTDDNEVKTFRHQL